MIYDCGHNSADWDVCPTCENERLLAVLKKTENDLTLARAESAGLGSQLLDVQRDRVAERLLADRLAVCAVHRDKCERRYARNCSCGYSEAKAAYDAARGKA